MKGNRKADTRPEIALRSELHRLGLRFRKNCLIEGARVRVDVAFAAARLAVFVDGCFWHSCSRHGTSPQVNRGYWGPKLERNVARDRRNDEALQALGWRVIRVWEHENATKAALRVAAAVRSARRAHSKAAS
jgi:DNA mismatch endonuclease (patch repair protein)